MTEDIAADPIILWFASRSEEAVKQASPIARIVANISKDLVAPGAQRASLEPEKQKQNQEDKEQGSKPIYHDDNSRAF